MVVKYNAVKTFGDKWLSYSPIETYFTITDDRNKERTIHVNSSEKYCLSVENTKNVYFSTEGSKCFDERVSILLMLD